MDLILFYPAVSWIMDGVPSSGVTVDFEAGYFCATWQDSVRNFVRHGLLGRINAAEVGRVSYCLTGSTWGLVSLDHQQQTGETQLTPLLSRRSG